jgi:hypothetical protein
MKVRHVYPPAGFLEQVGVQFTIFGFVDFAPDNLAAEDIQNQLEIPPSAARRSRQPGEEGEPRRPASFSAGGFRRPALITNTAWAETS